MLRAHVAAAEGKHEGNGYQESRGGACINERAPIMRELTKLSSSLLYFPVSMSRGLVDISSATYFVSSLA